MPSLDLNRILMTLPGILIALSVHEFAHGYTAYLLGDPTAKQYKRLTLNPIAHIDIIGFLMLIFAGFGWAKPVPINPNYFTRRKLGYFLVSIAGPLSNVLLAIFFSFVLGFQVQYFSNAILNNILVYTIFINLVLAVFNMFPIPPLDGSKLLLIALPDKYEAKFFGLEKYSYIILILLLVFNIIDKVLFPIVNFLFQLLMIMLMYVF
ncbi:peptidase M50 [Alkaliphilus metalliredigens QYMF]|uniref:Peptidase M50 n=1 Tax=Alkaliphilus metalliredigens (strain QYMF) TaxID=293826 RepID=A6TR65_ALKMQ|nr:site-2 protease family protein [Alkaliphilus metalliredigens]ABR48683.1 peptidase M50 [Alkaliphilus metalliredigens QYMF]